MKIILVSINYYKVGKNKYKPIRVIPIIASASLVNQILDIFIQLNQQEVV